MNIKTNNRPRDVLYWWNLTEKEKAEFDYLGTEASKNDATFFRYKGHCYALGEFMYCSSDALAAWYGYQSDTFFSGVVVRYGNAFDSVIVGTYFC